MCSIVTADMVRRQNECRQWKIRCALNESKEDAIKRFDRLWRSGMRASREDGVFWIKVQHLMKHSVIVIVSLR